jgi:hypothetical protein
MFIVQDRVSRKILPLEKTPIFSVRQVTVAMVTEIESLMSCLCKVHGYEVTERPNMKLNTQTSSYPL